MLNLSLKQRLFALVGSGLTVLLLTSAFTIITAGSTVGTLGDAYEQRVAALRDLKTIGDHYAVSIIETAQKVRAGQVSPQEGVVAIDNAARAIPTLWRRFSTAELEPDEMAIAGKLPPLFSTAEQAIDSLRVALQAGDREALATTLDGQLYTAVVPVLKTLGELVDVQLTLSTASVEAARSSQAISRNVLIGLVLAAIVAFILMANRLVQSFTRPIDEAVALCEQLATGNLAIGERPSRDDELGRLHRAIGDLAERWQAIVTDVNYAASAINTGAREIATGNMHLSERTEEQAANLEQTAASMEQMTATVRANADNAIKASQVATEARNEAERGARVVGGAREAMTAINSSSQKIADITGVVDEIAFQTNLLALNAAVEAARAGDAGRGFAVVAAEVRVLAQRSAEAAKQIKELIDDSVSKVADGSRLVGESESALTDIVDAIKRVAVIASEISASSSEQSDGIDQVNQAVSQMDRGTQQNTALVEQSAAAAKTLEEQAAALELIIERFALGAPVHPESQALPLAAPTPALAPPKTGATTCTPGRKLPPPAAGPKRSPGNVMPLKRPEKARPETASRSTHKASRLSASRVTAEAPRPVDATPVRATAQATRRKPAVTPVARPLGPKPTPNMVDEQGNTDKVAEPLRANQSAHDPMANWEEF